MPSVSGNVGPVFNGGIVSTKLAVNTTDPLADPIIGAQAPAGAENNGTLLLKLVSDISASLTVDTDASVLITNNSVGGVGTVQLDDTVGTLTVASGSATSPIRLFQDAAGNVFRVLAAGAVVTAQHAAPADAALAAGECALWFDQTNGAATLMVKAKQADGTVRTGSLALA